VDDADMPEAQRLNEGLDDLVVVLVCACRLRAVLGQEQALPADVLPLYPVKVLVSDMVFLLLKLNYESSNAIGAMASPCSATADWIYGAVACAWRHPAALLRPIRAKLHSSDAKDAAN
jgi:hypothetical protein